jgi:DNA polymerase-4/DNA polymerase V
MDGDAFFVGVEVAKNPKLKGLPVVTGEERGIVSALSYEAKALGIVRGMPIFKIRKDFKNVIVLPGDYRSYASYSKKMFDIVRRYTDKVEEYSIDECFADLTGWNKPFKMSYEDIARKIKNEVNKELDLSISIGLAPTKVLAKLASKWQKPNGLTFIYKKDINKFLEKTNIEKVWGIGPSTAVFLKKKGINTVFDFIQKDRHWIKENLSKPHEIIWYELKGESIVDIDKNKKTIYGSIQKTRSFHPFTNDKVFLLSQLSKHIEDSCNKARYYNLVSKEVFIFLKTKDFSYRSIKVVLPLPCNSPEIILSEATKYFDKIYLKDLKYRTVGVTLSGLIPKNASQNDLFGESNFIDKFEDIHKSIDKLEEKYGKRIVYLASTKNALNHNEKGTDIDDIDRDLLFL